MFGFGEKTYKAGNEGEIAENTQRVFIATREASRAWTGRVMTLSSAIIAFSVSVVSIKTFELSVDIEQLKLSWVLLLSALVFGAFNLLYESRVAYVSTWISKVIQLKSTDSVSLSDRFRASIILVIVFFYPSYGSKNKSVTSSKSYLLVDNWIQNIFGLVFIFEMATFILFVIGLLMFFTAFEV